MELFESIKDWFINLRWSVQIIIVGTPLLLYDYWKRQSYIKQEAKNKIEAYVCPKCLDEFKTHIEMCTDCGEKIVKGSELLDSEAFKKKYNQ